MAYSFLDLAYEVLEKAPGPLTSGEVWEQAKQHGLDKKLNTQGRTPWASLGAMLYTEILHNSTNSKLIKVGGRPKRFFLKNRRQEISEKFSDEMVFDKEEKNNGSAVRKASYQEKDLYPLLSYFAYTNPELSGERQIHTKTIMHQKTKGNSPREWLHPDMVGVYFPFEDLEKSVIELSGSLNSSSVFQLFSFELKKSITLGSYREYFFQAVSNSSWAHEGYLVAAEISKSEELHRELARLTNAFGIGVIHLNVQDIDSSHVLFNARNRETLDWDTINKLCAVNKDFASFIKRLNTDFGAGQIHPSEYDEIIKNPVTYIREKLKVKSVS